MHARDHARFVVVIDILSSMSCDVFSARRIGVFVILI